MDQPKHLMPIVATIFVTLFLWLSAIPLLSWYEFSAQHQELADAAFQWHQKRVSDYSFEYDYAGPDARRLPVPIRIHVRDSKFMAAYRIDDNEEVDMAAFPDVPETIDSVFEIARGLLAGYPYEIAIGYDVVLHYPTRIAVSYSDSGRDKATYYVRSLQKIYDSR